QAQPQRLAQPVQRPPRDVALAREEAGDLLRLAAALLAQPVGRLAGAAKEAPQLLPHGRLPARPLTCHGRLPPPGDFAPPHRPPVLTHVSMWVVAQSSVGLYGAGQRGSAALVREEGAGVGQRPGLLPALALAVDLPLGGEAGGLVGRQGEQPRRLPA